MLLQRNISDGIIMWEEASSDLMTLAGKKGGGKFK